MRFRRHISNDTRSVLDPVNLVFYGKASPAQVASLLRQALEPDWIDRNRPRWWLAQKVVDNIHPPMKAEIFDSVKGGWVRKEADEDLACRLVGGRYHIRIFGGGIDPKYGEWSIGAIHAEHMWLVRKSQFIDHVILSWKQPQWMLHGFFAQHPRQRNVRSRTRGRPRSYQTRSFDGVVTFVELT